MAEEGLAGARAVGVVAGPSPRNEGSDAVSYEALQDLLRSERRSNKLTPLSPRFWMQAREFLQTVTDAFRLEQARDPFGRKVMRLTDEVKNARHAAESVWALRERKLAMLALAATKERKVPDGITPDEADLYRRLLEDLDLLRAKVFDGVLGSEVPAMASPASPSPVTAQPLQMPLEPAPARPPLPASEHAGAPGHDPAPHTPAIPSAPTVVPADTKDSGLQSVTIRALGDIPPFVGPDMQTYLLKSGDIATVPPSIANLLVRRNKAAVVDA